MSIMHFTSVTCSTFPAGTVVKLSGENVSVTYESHAGIRVNTDGTVDKREGGTYTQIDGTTDWIIPNGDASSLYEVRVTNVSHTGGASGWSSAAAADNTWIAISANREWNVIADGPYTSDTRQANFDMQIRYNGGAVLTTGAYVLFSGET